MPGPAAVPIALGIGQILGNLFGNLFGAKTQASAAKKATDAQAAATMRAAELEKQSIDEALAYQKEIDARDYKDWLAREARDRSDWEATELRRAPYRALGDSAIRTLADYIRVPGMQPAQEVPVQRWSAPQPQMPTSSTMPVGGRPQLTPVMGQGGDFRAFLPQQQSPMLLEKFGRRPRTLADFAV